MPPLLFKVIDTVELKTNFGEKYEQRLLKRNHDWGIDDTLSMNPKFGYSEKGARIMFERMAELRMKNTTN